MPYKPGLTEAEKEVIRARGRRQHYLKQMGKAGFVDAGPMQARIRKLHDEHQITFQRISDKTGVDVQCIKWHYHGVAWARPGIPLTQCVWATANAVLTTPFGPADVRVHVRSHGTQRRLRALIAAGYAQRWLAEATGRDIRHLNAFLVKNRILVGAEHAAVVEQVYRKYIEVDPVEAGVTPRSVTYSKNVAAKHGYEPGSCWDEDTIDDPDAFPEWTGACGTDEGYKIHLREDIPVCRPCNEAVGRAVAPDGRFSPTKFRILIDTLDVGELAEKVGVSRDSIARWASGERNPSSKNVEAICLALDCHDSELLDEGDTIFYDKDFNRTAFALALEQKGMSKRQLAMEIGLSNMAVYYWITGQNTPKIPKIVKAAEVLGVDWKDFYR